MDLIALVSFSILFIRNSASSLIHFLFYNLRSKRQWQRPERFLRIRILRQLRKVDNPLQDHVSNSILQRCLVDVHYFGVRSLFHGISDDQYATGGRHLAIRRVGQNGG